VACVPVVAELLMLNNALYGNTNDLEDLYQEVSNKQKKK